MFDRRTVCFDSETTGLSPYLGARPFLWTMCDGSGWEHLARTDDPKAMRVVRDILGDPSVDKVAHNLKFDLKMAGHSGLRVRGRLHDTMIMATLVNEYEESHALKALARKWLGADTTAEDRLAEWFAKNAYQLRKRFGKGTGNWRRYDAVPREILEPYAMDDVRLCLRLFNLFSAPIERIYSQVYKLEMAFLPTIVGIEDRGHAVDRPYFAKMYRTSVRKLDAMRAELCRIAGDSSFNPDAPHQVGAVFRKLGVGSPMRTKKGNDSWGKDALAVIDHDFARGLLAYRELAKLSGTYYLPMVQASAHERVEGAPRLGVIHTTLWQTGSKGGGSVVTGRLSSSDPNFQNIPRRDTTVRRGFRPRPGYRLYYFDYKQIEMVLFACFARDERLIQAVIDGEDLHIRTARLLFGARYDSASEKVQGELRQIAKTINFGIIYGMGAKKLAKSLRELIIGSSAECRNACGIRPGDFTEDDARPILALYHRKLPSVSRYMKECMWAIGRNGYVSDPFGRRYHVPSDLRYKALNAQVQGCAANIMKAGVTRADQVLVDFQLSGIVNLVHDEVQVEVHDTERACVPLIKAALEDLGSFAAPILTDVKWSSSSWAEKQKWEEVA